MDEDDFERQDIRYSARDLAQQAELLKRKNKSPFKRWLLSRIIWFCKWAEEKHS